MRVYILCLISFLVVFGHVEAKRIGNKTTRAVRAETGDATYRIKTTDPSGEAILRMATPTQISTMKIRDSDDSLTLRDVTAGANWLLLKPGGEVEIVNVSGDGTGKATCVKSDGNLGTCTDQPNGSGVCTCA